MLFDFLNVFLEDNPSVEFFARFHKRAKVLFPVLELIVSGGVFLIVKGRKSQKRQKNSDQGLLVHGVVKGNNKKKLYLRLGYDPI